MESGLGKDNRHEPPQLSEGIVSKMSQNRDQFPPEKRSWIMSRVKARDTLPEVKLRKVLWGKGLRYRVHHRDLPGKPDVVFSKAKVVVFIDGAFWHGKKLSHDRLEQMSSYWREKIRRNAERDVSNTELLEAMGYIVFRFLDRDVLKDTISISMQIEHTVKERTTQRLDSLP